MAMNPIPPQAYTKESMLKAYAWLQNQDASIKEMATTPDILVSLYLKATRDGDSALDRPSIQNFKHELKQLAGLMGEFDKETVPTQSAPNPIPMRRDPQAKTSDGLNLDFAALEKKFNAAHNAAAATSVSSSSQTPTAMGLDPDGQSMSLINEVRQKLNLSSNSEAFKILIQVGYNKIKKLI